MVVVTKETIDYYIKLYKLPPTATWNDILKERKRVKDNSTPCLTNATNFDYSDKITNQEILIQFRKAIERERERRAVNWDYVPYTEWKNIQTLDPAKKEEIPSLSSDFVASSSVLNEIIDRIDSLGSFKVSSSELFQVGSVVSKTNLKLLGKTINDNEIMCLCDCNYCTCDCNYCTCDCNYCTCDCNYKNNLVQSTYFNIKMNYGYTGAKNKSKTSYKDGTHTDYTNTSTNDTIWAIDWCTCDCNYCTCDCNYCTCDCNYCTCDCNYCTCDCNYCTCDCNYIVSKETKAIIDKTSYAIGTRSMTGHVSNYCTCDCNYCTCDCNYCTCDCNYCTCDCNYCTCDCNYCTCNCNQCVTYWYGRCAKWG